jgi:DNA repair protein RadD
MMKVSYHCGNKTVSEYICIEHKGFALHKAKHWISYRGGEPVTKAAELLALSKTLRTPIKILVQKKGKYHTVNDAEFEEPVAL